MGKDDHWERLVDAGATALAHASAGFFVQDRNAREMTAIVLNALTAAEPDHFVSFDEAGWFIEHSMGCRLAGTIGTCSYNRAIREVYDEAPDPEDFGRWRITNIDSEGLPSLERADAAG